MSAITAFGARMLASPYGYLIWVLFFSTCLGLIAISQMRKLLVGLSTGVITSRKNVFSRQVNPAAFWMTAGASTFISAIFLLLAVLIASAYAGDFVAQGTFPKTPAGITDARVRGWR